MLLRDLRKRESKSQLVVGKKSVMIADNVERIADSLDIAEEKTMKSPNILYFVCHDLGRMLGCYGARVATPNLDRFAADGVKFTNAFCSSPACSPSRGCAMTGQYAHTNGLMGLVNGGWTIPKEKKTIGQYQSSSSGWANCRCH